MTEMIDFKAAMRRLVTGVTIIATETDEGHRHGLTATAVTSVCADPPTVLCCINRSASAATHISRSRRFSINVLPVEATALSQRFSGSGPAAERFSTGSWMTLATGAPVLREALTAFDCRIQEQTEVGSHSILLATVEAVHISNVPGKPLLYGMAGYGTFEPA